MSCQEPLRESCIAQLLQARPCARALQGHQANPQLCRRKGEYLQQAAQELGCSYAALEYRGQGRSDGSYLDCSLQDWIDDVVYMLDQATPGASHILVGSSLGAWLALHAALARPQAVRGLLLVAPAVDISRHWEQVARPRAAAEGKGLAEARGDARDADEGIAGTGSELLILPSSYIEGGIPLRCSFIQDANERHLLLARTGAARLAQLHCAVHVLYCERDDAVPAHIPQQLGQVLREAGGCPYVELENVPDGDHRLSREADLDRMGRALRTLCSHIRSSSQ